MAAVQVDMVRVFADEDGRHGTPLAIVQRDVVAPPGADADAEAPLRALARRTGTDFTAFVGGGRVVVHAAADERAGEFAVHPVIGAAWWLDAHGAVEPGPVTIDTAAGSVSVRLEPGLLWARIRADWTPEYGFYELTGTKAVDAARPDDYTAGHNCVWAWIDETESRVRARTFDGAGREPSPTGAAAARLTRHLRHALLVRQGRGSVVHTVFDTAGWTEVGGRVVADASRTL
ncbi:PhzF family phenazine biosynthesis protein [Rhodococcus sp. HNM0569]|uniref:PhzF family phenazine biosynthesis protein n=1 Tax=Rhodococcus sp. HNM0569 TaxID=2716340 RepID=UPI00146B9346|nr:PhzF family phenazine biosynthesis protein [Rhodococcus sp. HNM0569]NLU81411.1 PhzF family phenazine biosynthesis protein [Rhodococcus sp. HNM0569]